MKEENTKKQQRARKNHKQRQRKKRAGDHGGSNRPEESNEHGRDSPELLEPLNYTGPKNCRSGLSDKVYLLFMTADSYHFEIRSIICFICQRSLSLFFCILAAVFSDLDKLF